MIPKRFLCVAAITVMITSCSGDPLDVDVSGVVVDTEFTNLDSVIFHADSAELIRQHRAFKKELGELYDYYRDYVMEIGEVEDTAFYNRIRIFREDEGIRILEEEIAAEFDDLSLVTEKLKDGFRHLKYHLPEEAIPDKIVYMNSLFRANVWCTESEIAVGLEWYLGPEAESVKRLPPAHYNWMREAMLRKFLEVDVLTTWIETNILEDQTVNLAEKMVRWGKILYLVQAAFPEMEEHLILRYNEDQFHWAVENEYAFWKYLVDEKMLFEEKELNERNFLHPGPTTPGLPTEGAPDRLGRFTGFRMVLSYLEKNDVSPAELIKTDYNSILQSYEIE